MRDITEARFLIVRSKVEDAWAMTRIVYAILSSASRRIDLLQDAPREARSLDLSMPRDLNRAARLLERAGVIRLSRVKGRRVCESIITDADLCRVVQYLRQRLSADDGHRAGFPSAWGNVPGLMDVGCMRCGPFPDDCTRIIEIVKLNEQTDGQAK